jgi:hypothetical protein
LARFVVIRVNGRNGNGRTGSQDMDYGRLHDFLTRRENTDSLGDLDSGCSAAWLARLLWEQDVGGSNPLTPIFVWARPMRTSVKTSLRDPFGTGVLTFHSPRYRLKPTSQQQTWGAPSRLRRGGFPLCAAGLPACHQPPQLLGSSWAAGVPPAPAVVPVSQYPLMATATGHLQKSNSTGLRPVPFTP